MKNGFGDEIAEKIAACMRQYTGCRDILCVLRYCEYALPLQRKKADLNYFCVGRSSGFDPARAKAGSVIPGDKGTPLVFWSIGCLGALNYIDFETAGKHGFYYKTESEKKQKRQWESLITVPINLCANDERREMIGFISVNAKKKMFFRRNCH